MPILVMCTNPACGELFDAPDSSAGQEVRCPACGAAQKLADAPAAPAAPAPDPAEAPPSAAAPAGKPLFSVHPAAGGKEEVELEAIDLDPGAVPSAASPSASSSAPAVPSTPAGPAAPQTAPARPTPAVPQPPATPAPESVDEILFETKPTKGGAVAPPDKAPAPPASRPGGPAAAGFAEQGRAQLDDLRREGAPQPSVQAELEDAIWIAAPAGDAETDAEVEGGAASDSVLGHRPSAAMVFILGLAGLGIGLVAGIKLFPDQYLLAAYLGAGVGWMAGFTFGTLLILGAEQAGGKVRCPVCHTEYPAETEECRVCGSQSLGPAPDPLAIECLHAGSFALSNPSGLLPPVVLGVVAVLLASTTVEVLRAYPKEAAQWAPILIGLSATVGYGVFSYWMAFLLSAAAQPPPRVNLPSKGPKAPRLGSLETVTSGFWTLAALAAYVVPLVTIPLLPVAMLLLSTPGKKQALNPLLSARAAWRHPKGFVVLWMFLMMWLAGAVLASIVVKVLYDLRLSFPPVAGFSGGVLTVTLSALAAGAFGVVAAIFGLAIFRCLGAFGKYNASALPPPPAGSRAG